MAAKGGCRMIVPAGAARPTPKIGQALGPLGVNMMEFCKTFNARTSEFKANTDLRVKLEAFEDRTFKFDVFPPTTSWFLKQAAGIKKGASQPGHETAGNISARAIYEIAASRKRHDPNVKDVALESVARSVAASARSLGLQIDK